MNSPAPRRRIAAGRRLARLLEGAVLVLVGGCSLVPNRPTPPAPTSAHWSAPPPGWLAAAPADTLDRGPWWQRFEDPVLDALVPRVAATNQNLAQLAAAVEQSRALLAYQRASLFPSVSAVAGAQRTAAGAATAGQPPVTRSFRLGVQAGWDPDLWGSLRASTAAQQARTEASVADLANATLSAQASFVSDYLTARELDAELAILEATVAGDERALLITQNRYQAAVAPETDVLQARAQLATTRASLAALGEQRARNLHAMAVLLGQPPAAFQLPDGPWNRERVPPVPPGLPSELLQRRPDIAAAERAVAVANAQVGVARAAFFPSLTLSASRTQDAPRLGSLFDAAAGTWGLGLSLAQTLLDFGALSASDRGAHAAWDQAVAAYRQTVLAAFQEVEDDLAMAASLEQQQAQQRLASEAADRAEQQMLNRYREGINAYSDVITAQASALSARRALLQLTVQRQTADVALIAALGGGWDRSRLAADAAH